MIQYASGDNYMLNSDRVPIEPDMKHVQSSHSKVRRLKQQASMIKQGMSNPAQYMRYMNKIESLDERLD